MAELEKAKEVRENTSILALNTIITRGEGERPKEFGRQEDNARYERWYERETEATTRRLKGREQMERERERSPAYTRLSVSHSSSLQGAGAISSALAAAEFGLRVLEAGIEDQSENTTRFFVIGKHYGEPSGHFSPPSTISLPLPLSFSVLSPL